MLQIESKKIKAFKNVGSERCFFPFFKYIYNFIQQVKLIKRDK